VQNTSSSTAKTTQTRPTRGNFGLVKALIDFDGQIKPWKDGKELLKEVKDKDKDVKEKDKETKETKEKREIKELKAEKVEKPEFDGVFARSARDDPRIEQIIRALAGMSAKVDQLTDQLEALRKERG